MKDTEFMELLNDYIDHEITAGNAARLEAEVLRNPERRRIYRQYCRMQKACSLLAATASPDAPREVLTAESPRIRGIGAYSAVGLLAAACIAVVVVIQTRHRQPAAVPQDGIAAIPSKPAAPAANETVVSTISAMPIRSDLRPVFNLVQQAPGRAGEVLPPNGSFAWMNEIHLAPIQQKPLDLAAFEAQKAVIKVGIKPPVQPAPSSLDTVEQAAFQFQR